MDKITFNIEDFDVLYSKFKSLSDKSKAEVRNEFAASALNIQSNAKKNAPVNLGNLRNSIIVDQSGDNSNFTFIISAKASYSPYVEFGTGGKVSVPSSYAEYASTFKGKNKGKYKEFIEALILWVRRKGIGSGNDKSTAYVIARSILRKGIRPQPFMIPAYEQEKSKLLNRIKQILNA